MCLFFVGRVGVEGVGVCISLAGTRAAQVPGPPKEGGKGEGERGGEKGGPLPFSL